MVYYYDSYVYLFWYDNRVWQVRLDKRYEGSLGGVFMGDPKEKVLELLGAPFYADGESIIYNLPDRGYPVRIRLFFEEDLLSDLYIYRSDF